MKFLKSFLIAGLLMAGVSATAQEKHIRIGYTNVEAIVSQMPESKQIENELKTYKSQLDNQLQAKIKDFQAKYEAYQRGASMMSDVIKADKERELQDMQGQMEEFQKNAEASMQRKQEQLLEPVLTKVQKAIDEVANENGFAYVFNSDGGMGMSIILHAPEKDDVTPLVLKKLGITPPAPKAATTPAPATSPAGAAKPAVKPAGK